MKLCTQSKRITYLRRFLPLAFLLLLATACAQMHPGKAQPDTPPLFPTADFSLTVLHTNDVHSAYGGLTDKGLICYAALCEGGRGGYVRLDQAVRAIRQDNPDALFLDAGDIFQGTLFWVQDKERMPAALVDRMGYQAIIPGNHEFDEGWPTWLRYVESLKTPVLAANISFDSRPSVPADAPAAGKILPYTIVERNGRKIGIVGVTTTETPEKSYPGPGISFNDAAKALQAAVEHLTVQNVSIIIALAHLGLENDRQLARSVDGVDIVVGAHSHSLLSNTSGKAEGPYPVVEKTPDGAPVLVVTASTACTYLGRLDVGFDREGVVREWRGEPVLLDQANFAALDAPAPDAELARLIDGFAAPVMEMMQTPVGRIDVAGPLAAQDGLPLEEPTVMECRKAECLSGNVVADAMRLVPFKDAQIALVNGGALRVSLPGGVVTPGDVIGTLPFQNTLLIADMPGSVILQALEHGIANYGAGGGSFLQVSGLRYAFTPSNEPGRRVTKAEVLGKDGRFRSLDEKTTYKVVTLNFLARGGDGFAMFSPLRWEEGAMLGNDALRTYLERESPVKIVPQGRITIR